MPVRFQGDTSVYRSLTLDSLMDSLGKERLDCASLLGKIAQGSYLSSH